MLSKNTTFNNIHRPGDFKEAAGKERSADRQPNKTPCGQAISDKITSATNI